MKSCHITLRRCRGWLGLTAAVTLIIAAGTITFGGVASAQPPPPPAKIDRDASAKLEWSVPERYDASWRAWNWLGARYNPNAVTPPPPNAWSINLDACKSHAPRVIERYTFVISGITDPTYRRTLDGRACSYHLDHALPVMGLYRVVVTVHTALGVSAPETRIVEVRDYLIVSIGDSLQSGEGVPDVRGRFTFGHISSDWTVDFIHQEQPAIWMDRRCHRSALSGPALAAQAIEAASPYTSVTFLSYACSGAELKHLYREQYEGAEPGEFRLDPQIDAVAAAVGSRQIDALLVDGGINDLGFASIIKDCATNVTWGPGTDCVIGSPGAKLVHESKFAARYDQLARAIRDRLNVREVYLNGYPSTEFHGGGCGLLGVRGVGIDPAEAEEMNTMGIFLNHQIELAVSRHRADHWNLIGDLTAPFEPHAYCSKHPWVTWLEDSLRYQGDKQGTAHPNRAGHRAFGRVLGQAIVPDQPQTPFRTALLVIDKIKLPLSREGAKVVEMELNVPGGIERRVTVPRTGQFEAVDPQFGTFHVQLFRTPASPRHATEVRMTFDHILTLHHGFADGYGPGKHEIANPNQLIAVQYHIKVAGPRGGQQPVNPTPGR